MMTLGPNHLSKAKVCGFSVSSVTKDEGYILVMESWTNSSKMKFTF